MLFSFDPLKSYENKSIQSHKNMPILEYIRKDIS